MTPQSPEPRPTSGRQPYCKPSVAQLYYTADAAVTFQGSCKSETGPGPDNPCFDAGFCSDLGS